MLNLIGFIICAFRIPVADLRDTVSASARPPHWIRRIHDESLQLTLIDASLEMSAFDPSQITVHGSISLSAASLYGTTSIRFVFS